MAPPPPLQVGHQALNPKSPDIWVMNEIIRRKMGRNLSEDLFFCSSPDFGRKIGRNLSEDLFFALHLISSEKLDEI